MSSEAAPATAPSPQRLRHPAVYRTAEAFSGQLGLRRCSRGLFHAEVKDAGARI